MAAPHTIARAAALARGTIVRHEAPAFASSLARASFFDASFFESSAAFAAIIAASARARRPSGALARTVRLSEPRMARSSCTRSRHPSQDVTCSSMAQTAEGSSSPSAYAPKRWQKFLHVRSSENIIRPRLQFVSSRGRPRCPPERKHSTPRYLHPLRSPSQAHGCRANAGAAFDRDVAGSSPCRWGSP